MNVARFNFCLSHEDPEIVKKGLVLFTQQILHENDAIRSFGYNGRGVASFSGSNESNVHPQRVRGLLAAYLENSPKLEEFFVLWDLPDYGTDKDVSSVHMQALAAVLHCSYISHATLCNSVVSRIIYERGRSLKSQLTSTFAPLLHSTLGLIIACAHCGSDGRRDIALKFMIRNAPTIAALTQKGKVVSWEIPNNHNDMNNDDSIREKLSTDTRCLLTVLVHALLESTDSEVLNTCIGTDSLLRKLLNSIHRDNKDTAICMFNMLTEQFQMKHDPLLQNYKSPILDTGFQKRILNMQIESADPESELESSINTFLTSYTTALSQKALKTHNLRSSLEKLLGSLNASSMSKHKDLELLILKIHPDMLRISMNSIAHVWEPEVTHKFVESFGHLCHLLDNNTTNLTSFTSYFDGLSKYSVSHSGVHGNNTSFENNELDHFVYEVQQNRRIIARQSIVASQMKSAVENLLSRLIPRALGKKELSKTLTHSNGYLKRMGLLYLKALLNAIHIIRTNIKQQNIEVQLATELSTKLPEMSTLVHLRNELMKAALGPDSIVDSAANYLLDLLHDVFELYVLETPSSVRTSGFDLVKLLDDTLIWSNGATCEDVVKITEKLLLKSKCAYKPIVLRTLKILDIATENKLCRWMGTADEAAKAVHATIVNDRVGSAKPSALSRLILLCSVKSSGIKDSLDKVRSNAMTVLRKVLHVSGSFSGDLSLEVNAWCDLAQTGTIAVCALDLLLRLGYHWGPSLLASNSSLLQMPLSATLCSTIVVCSSNFTSILSRIPGGTALAGKGPNAISDLCNALTHIVLVYGQFVPDIDTFLQTLNSLCIENGSSDDLHGWNAVEDIQVLLQDCLGDSSGISNSDTETKSKHINDFWLNPNKVCAQSAVVAGGNLTDASSFSCWYLISMKYLRSILSGQVPTEEALVWISEQASKHASVQSPPPMLLSQLLSLLLTLQKLGNELQNSTGFTGNKRKSRVVEKSTVSRRTRSNSNTSATSTDNEANLGEERSYVTTSEIIQNCEQKLTSVIVACIWQLRGTSFGKSLRNLNVSKLLTHQPTAMLVAASTASAILANPHNKIDTDTLVALERMVLAALPSCKLGNKNVKSQVTSAMQSENTRVLGAILLRIESLFATNISTAADENQSSMVANGMCALLREATATYMTEAGEMLSLLQLQGDTIGTLSAPVAAKLAMKTVISEQGCQLQDMLEVTSLRAQWGSKGEILQLEDPLTALIPDDPTSAKHIHASLSSINESAGSAASSMLNLGPSWRLWGMKNAHDLINSGSLKKKNGTDKQSLCAAALMHWASRPLLAPATRLLADSDPAQSVSIISLCATDGTLSILEKIPAEESILEDILKSFSTYSHKLCQALATLLSNTAIVMTTEVDTIMSLLVQGLLSCSNENDSKLKVLLAVSEQSLLVTKSMKLTRPASQAWMELFIAVLHEQRLYMESTMTNKCHNGANWSIMRVTRLIQLVQTIENGPTCILQVPFEDDAMSEIYSSAIQSHLLCCIKSGLCNDIISSDMVNLFEIVPRNLVPIDKILIELLEISAIDTLLEHNEVIEIVLLLLTKCSDVSAIDDDILLVLAKVLAKGYTGTMSYSDRLKARIVWILTNSGMCPPMQALKPIAWDAESSTITTDDKANTTLPVRAGGAIGPTLSHFPSWRCFVPQPIVALEGKKAVEEHKELMQSHLREANDGWSNSKEYLLILDKENSKAITDDNNDEDNHSITSDTNNDVKSVGGSDSDSDDSLSDSDSDDSLSDSDSDTENSVDDGDSWPWHLHEDYKTLKVGAISSLDPSFWLPALLVHLQAKEPSVRRLASTGMLALPLSALCAECPILRGCAQACLSRLLYLLRAQDASKDVSFRERPQLLQLMEFTKNALLATVSPSISSVHGTLLPAQTALFLARSSMILLHVANEIYAPVSKYLLSRPFCDTKDTPLWDMIVTDGTSSDARLIVLRGIRDGLLSHSDHLNLCRKHAYQRLMSIFAPLSHADTRTGHAIIDILEVALSQRANSRYLLERCSLVPWLGQVVSLLAQAPGATPCRSVASPRLLSRMLLLMRRAAAANTLLVRTEGAVNCLPSLQNCAIILASQASESSACGIRPALGYDALKQLVLFMWDVTILHEDDSSSIVPALVWDTSLLCNLATTVRAVVGEGSDVEISLALLAAAASGSDGCQDDEAVGALLGRLLSGGKSGLSAIPQIGSFEHTLSSIEIAKHDKQRKSYESILDALNMHNTTDDVTAITNRRHLWIGLSRWDPQETVVPTLGTDVATDDNIISLSSHAAMSLMLSLSSTGDHCHSLHHQCAKWAIVTHIQARTGRYSSIVKQSNSINTMLRRQYASTTECSSFNSNVSLANLAIHGLLGSLTECPDDIKSLLQESLVYFNGTSSTYAQKALQCVGYLAAAVIEVATWFTSSNNTAAITTLSSIASNPSLKNKINSLENFLKQIRNIQNGDHTKDDMEVESEKIDSVEERDVHARGFLFDAGRWRNNLFSHAFTDTSD
jgi:hypothetical protein